MEVTSPQLIEKVRTATTDSNGRYQITNLPVGTYTVAFKLDGFATVEHSNVELSTDFTAPINAEMKVGPRTEIVTVVGTSVPLVDVQNARQRQVFTGDEIADLPTTRNLGDLVQLVPGLSITAANAGNSVPSICSGGQGDAGGLFGSQSGALSGCSPIFEGFNAHSSSNDPDSINQGRMQVDGLGINSFLGGGRSSYITDVGNAQEVTLTLSGALGESETGGATINVVPRTGGNRFAGNYFTAYSNDKFFDKNNSAYSNTTFTNRLIKEYDVNGAYGGPIKRDRLWFYSAARRQERDNLLLNNYRNLNEGVFGANYAWNPNGKLNQSDLYQNVNTRLTLQATRRDKINIFWDEQYTCENPCEGAGTGISVEATSSLLTRPLRVIQTSWTNPFTNRILLEGGFSYYTSHRDETKARGETAYPQIPRLTETGTTTNVTPNAAGTAITSGSINNAINWDIKNIQTRGSASYVTGSHNFKIGYQGQYLSQRSEPFFNDLRLAYGYATPASTCTPTPEVVQASGTASTWCGLMPDGRRAFDGLPQSAPLGTALATSARPPVPTSFTQYIPSATDQAAWFTSFYVQDQWTWNRLTLNGALRYDNAKSGYKETCVGPDLYTPLQYCLNEGGQDGVSFQDITPRWGVAYDVFGNGKTAVKYSMGKYLQGAQVGGIYTASNAAGVGRTINSYGRVWRDLDGDRVVDCDLAIPVVAPGTGGLPPNGECGGPAGFGVTAATARRFGRSPDDLDDLGLAIGLGTIYCGIDEPSMAQAARNYCNNYFAAGGSSLLEGWNKRQYEWQWSIGVQHQILPRLSGEVTFNRRDKYNVTASDAVGSGCDLYSGTTNPNAVNPKQCMDDLLNFESPFYDFYSVQAPLDPRLPRGGGYLVEGFATQKTRRDGPGNSGDRCDDRSRWVQPRLLGRRGHELRVARCRRSASERWNEHGSA